MPPPDRPRPRRCYAEEAPPFHLPDWLWGPVGSGILILIPGLLSLAFSQPWLFPSLAPSSYTHVTEPHRKSARLYNTIVGQFLAVGVGYLFSWVFAVDLHPAVSGSVAPHAALVWATAAGFSLTALLQWLLDAVHPPAGATLMLITLGAFRLRPHDAVALLIGITIMALAGEVFRDLRMRQAKCEERPPES